MFEIFFINLLIDDNFTPRKGVPEFWRALVITSSVDHNKNLHMSRQFHCRKRVKILIEFEISLMGRAPAVFPLKMLPPAKTVHIQ